MINNIIIICNVVTLFFYSLFMGDGGVSVTGNLPASLKSGQSITAELKVSKGNSSGFAKLQMDIPEGLTITEIDNMGASFTAVDGIAKWVWSSLPAASEIVVKFNLVAASDANGSKTLSAKYSYVEGANKQVVEMTPHELMIGDVAVANTTSSVNTNTIASSESNSNNNTTATGAANPSSNLEPNAKIAVERSVSKGSSDNEQIITLKINKGNTKGFGRYSDDLPAGYAAKAITTEGSSFTTADDKIKFVWVTVPEKEILSISYALVATNASTLVLKGEYAYLEENQSKKFLVTQENVVFGGPLNLATTNIADTPNESKSTTTSTETTVNSTSTEKSTDANTNNNNSSSNGNINNTNNTNNETAITGSTETSTKINNSTANVDYRVQIGAFSNSGVSASVLASTFNITEKISSEMQGGFSKFMIGNYSEYKFARDKRESTLSKGVNGAFVVAYNSGKRITVQEALMLSNQKWFK
jgi:hypothetical protein